MRQPLSGSLSALELADVNVQRARLNLVIEPPDGLQQVGARQQAAHVAKQNQGQLELAQGQLHRLAVELDRAGDGVQYEGGMDSGLGIAPALSARRLSATSRASNSAGRGGFAR